MDTKNGGPAFPALYQASVSGMTLRDYFAAKALPEVIRKYPISDTTTIPEAAQMAYELADAMIAARETK